MHLLVSDGYLQKPGKEPVLDIWRRTFAPGATATLIRSGHFLAEENASETLAALTAFLQA